MLRDPRIDQLADQLVNYSTSVKPGEVALIEYEGPEAMTQAFACAEAVVKAGGIPLVQDMEKRFRRFMVTHSNEDQIKTLGEHLLRQMKDVQVYIALRGSPNVYEMNGAPEENQGWYLQHVHIPVMLEQRVRHTRWVVTRYPTPSMAQLAETNTDDFEDYYFRVCCLDYRRMAEAVQPLKELMNNTDRVRILGPETELEFSIKGIPAVPCVGDRNIPDGECFTAPVRDSINGTVLYNCKTMDRESGESFEFVKVTFKDGKAIDVQAEDEAKTRALNKIFDRDEGARYIGEFAIAFNPHITDPINDILFDEKIKGSFHMAFGQAYEEADNQNRSQNHWDLIQIQRPEYGGGEIWFDDVLIRKDGVFVVKELEGLNPENLA